ncbi:acyl-CoA dehydrogenase [Cupriavidus gilardii J11]|uniref:Acyl-CoA dehydrogenase n=1 Tax=Cupriavidus gilardii J11 TaxID=936133 RepID=A0A562BL29_9BURK|nr:acyl-CoA dehydrogenase family protein [Cupriavidus gilardii]TWG85630.1 acyl-CoA dehydrogenase [Cupriavidus gilardii J11]
MQNAYSDALEAILRDHCSPATVRDIDEGGSADALWRSMAESGFVDCLLPEDADGAALSLREATAILHVLGAFAMPLPVGQTMVARSLLDAAGQAVPDGPIALAGFADGATSALIADGRHAAWYLVQLDDRCQLLPRDSGLVQHTGVHADGAVWLARPSIPADRTFTLPAGTLRYLGACVHAAHLAGAMERILVLTLQYANDREQFGRPIGKFQAIQHQVSEMAEHVAAARMAAQLACDTDGIQPHPLRVAIGKLRTSEAVTPVAAIAHAVHGAIGMTHEYDLQLYTRRLHAWRVADGSEQWWAEVIGAAAVDESACGAVEQIRRWCE